MSESTRSLTPAARSLAPSDLPPRKIRLRIVAPTPSLQFLAPFSHDDPDCFASLQRFVHAQLIKRARDADERSELENGGWEELAFEIDGFDVPFDDPDILRDGDTLHVRLHAIQPQHDEEEEDDVEEDDDEEDEAEDLERGMVDEDERHAVLEAARVAAMLRAGLHRMPTDDDEAARSTANQAIYRACLAPSPP